LIVRLSSINDSHGHAAIVLRDRRKEKGEESILPFSFLLCALGRMAA